MGTDVAAAEWAPVGVPFGLMTADGVGILTPL
jgi:hypothetical protein